MNKGKSAVDHGIFGFITTFKSFQDTVAYLLLFK